MNACTNSLVGIGLRYRQDDGGYLLTDPLFIRLPSLLPVSLGASLDILFSLDLVNPPTDNDDIALAILDDLGWGSVLLTHSISFLFKINPGSKSQEILIILAQPLHGDESENELWVFSGHLDDRFGI